MMIAETRTEMALMITMVETDVDMVAVTIAMVIDVTMVGEMIAMATEESMVTDVVDMVGVAGMEDVGVQSRGERSLRWNVHASNCSLDQNQWKRLPVSVVCCCVVEAANVYYMAYPITSANLAHTHTHTQAQRDGLPVLLYLVGPSLWTLQPGRERLKRS